MYVSKTRFINWTRCPMYFPLELKYNPGSQEDINAEYEYRKEKLKELLTSMPDDSDEESFEAINDDELEVLLPYYNQVEEEALKVAKKYFEGTFIADSKDVHNQKLFEYKSNGHTYRCYVDIYNENAQEINIIEVKATTGSKFCLDFSDKKRGGQKFPLFKAANNIWKLNHADSAISADAETNFNNKKNLLLNRYRKEGKYPHDLAFQKFVIDNALRLAGDFRPVHYYLAVLNNAYVYDGKQDANGACVYDMVDGEEIITFIEMDEIVADYQPIISEELKKLEHYISNPHNIETEVEVGEWCAWGAKTECVFSDYCFKELRGVPEYNRANSYVNCNGFPAGKIANKYQLINEGYCKLDDVPREWLEKENHLIQRKCYEDGTEHINKEKMEYWLKKIQYPIYHFDFESFPCPLPRFRGENPYRQSVFEFSLHIEREPGICDKVKDNIIFLNQENYDDEREALAKAIVDHFEFNEDGTLHGTMLAQNTNFEMQRLAELAQLYPQYADKLHAICNSSADLIHLLKTKKDLYKDAFPDSADCLNYYHKDLSGSYSIKKTLPVLVPTLTYKGMDVGNGVQAYVTYLNYDSCSSTFGIMQTKEERRQALSLYCQQDTWAMVEILRAIRSKISE